MDDRDLEMLKMTIRLEIYEEVAKEMQRRIKICNTLDPEGVHANTAPVVFRSSPMYFNGKAKECRDTLRKLEEAKTNQASEVIF